jgi:hypothetical protein
MRVELDVWHEHMFAPAPDRSVSYAGARS